MGSGTNAPRHDDPGIPRLREHAYDLTSLQSSTCLVEVTCPDSGATHQNSRTPTGAAWNLA